MGKSSKKQKNQPAKEKTIEQAVRPEKIAGIIKYTMIGFGILIVAINIKRARPWDVKAYEKKKSKQYGMLPIKKSLETLSVELHRKIRGKIETNARVDLDDDEDIGAVYFPGVKEVCKEIIKNHWEVDQLTRRGYSIGIFSDGSGVFDLGDIGTEAVLPVLEGKAAIFKKFVNIDAIPIILKSREIDDIVKTIETISSTFSAIVLEGISAPRSVEIESRLRDSLSIPVFNDNEHGTPVAIVAALKNSLKGLSKSLSDAKIVINGLGIEGSATVNLLIKAGCNADKMIIVNDGKIVNENDENLTALQKEMVSKTNNGDVTGQLEDALKFADVLISFVEFKKDYVKEMREKPIIFAMSEFDGHRIRSAGVYADAKQVSSVAVFPGLVRGMLNAQASYVNDEILLAAADALAGALKKIEHDVILPNAFDNHVKSSIAKAVTKAAKDSGAAHKHK